MRSGDKVGSKRTSHGEGTGAYMKLQVQLEPIETARHSYICVDA